MTTIPLMRGGGESAIIKKWVAEAERRLADERDRADLGSLAKFFAVLAGCRPAWNHGLRGWNMKSSPFLDETRAEEARTLVLLQGQEKFGKAPTKKQQRALETITDLARLEAVAKRLIAVDSWGELLSSSE